MAYCPNCGVELAPDARACPLCLAPVGGAPGHERHPERMIDPEDQEKLTQGERSTIAWELISVSILIAAIVVVAVNLLANRAVSWSLYPLFSLALVWVFITSPLMLGRKPALAVLFPALAVPAFLVGVDLVDGSLSWAPGLAVPVAVIAELCVAGAALGITRVQRKGLNIVAFVLLAVAAFCLGTEASIQLFLGTGIELRWSAIVALALVPIAGFMIYLHYRIVKKSNLRKLFRL